MAILTSYGALTAAIARWLNREDDADIDQRAAEFVELAEARIRRNQEWFRRIYSLSNNNVPFYIDAAPDTLPSDVLRVDAMWAAVAGTYSHTIEIVTPTGWRDLVQADSSSGGIPTHAMIVPYMDSFNNIIANATGPKLYLWPEPAVDSSFAVDFSYIRDVPPLATDSTTNGLFTRHPDLYLYGALCEAAPFYEHDQRLQMWEQRYQQAVDDVNRERERAEHPSGVRPRLPRSF